MRRGCKDIREIRAKIEQGFATGADAATLMDVIRGLVWESRIGLNGEPVEVCRHCINRREVGHNRLCVAVGIE